jgi:hypothetical protein
MAGYLAEYQRHSREETFRLTHEGVPITSWPDRRDGDLYVSRDRNWNVTDYFPENRSDPELGRNISIWVKIKPDSQNFTVELSLQLTQIAIDKITVRRRAFVICGGFLVSRASNESR